MKIKLTIEYGLKTYQGFFHITDSFQAFENAFWAGMQSDQEFIKLTPVSGWNTCAIRKSEINSVEIVRDR